MKDLAVKKTKAKIPYDLVEPDCSKTKKKKIKNPGMTVRDFIKMLETFPADSLVVMATNNDKENNPEKRLGFWNHSLPRTIDEVKYVPETLYRGHLIDKNCPDPNGVPAIAIWPSDYFD